MSVGVDYDEFWHRENGGDAEAKMYEAWMDSETDRFERWAKKAEKMGKKNWCGEGYRVYVNGDYKSFGLTLREAHKYANAWKKEDPSRVIEIKKGEL